MAPSFNYRIYPYRRSVDQDAGTPAHHPVVVTGGGMVGLAFAVDMSLRGVPVVLLDEDDKVSFGSRSICVAKRTLEIFDRLGIGQRCADKGITWHTGRLLHGDKLIYEFDLLPQAGHRRPAFVNLQQYYVETFLIERFHELGQGELRWRNKVVGVAQDGERVEVHIETPGGPYRLTCDWLVAADGVHSVVRRKLDLPFVGETFHDHFLIVDVVMRSDLPNERRFWFDPTFHTGGSALLHKQPDDIWRIDLQLGPDADRDEELKQKNLTSRIRSMLGEDADFSIDWSSVYTFQCRRLEKFRHGNIIFVGDAAHTVSPFGARGGNGGIQDTDNLAWKLAAVVAGRAPASLIDSYDAERIPAADENIVNSTRATDFIAPRNRTMSLFRAAVLELAEEHLFARPFVNSGRLSVPDVYETSPLNTPDVDTFSQEMRPGTPAADAPIRSPDGQSWFLGKLDGAFTLLCFGERVARLDDLPIRQLAVGADIDDRDGLLAAQCDARPGTAYLFRPDQHVAARFRRPTRAAVTAAHERAMGKA